MNVPDMILRIEASLAAKKIPIDDLCSRAKVSRSTWQRWKAGTVGPTMAKWQDVETALAALNPDAAAA